MHAFNPYVLADVIGGLVERESVPLAHVYSAVYVYSVLLRAKNA